jgi:hypothetical protein
MTWVISFTVAVLGGVSGLFLAGFVANACVSWYRIPAREGASGYFVVFIALGGGVAGLIVSFITARVIAATWGPGFPKELGGVLCVLLLIAGIAAIICRLLAHVPPTIDGQELNLEVEFRFPSGTATSPPTAEGEWQVRLDSLTFNNPGGWYGAGEIDTAAARLESGQWIVPTKMSLFTGRGKRCVRLYKPGAEAGFGFMLPVPRHPGKNFEQWSSWLPKQQASGQPWPPDKMACRYRVQIKPPPPPPKNYEAEAAEKKEAEFVALPPDAPLSAWLPCTTYEQPQTKRALQAISQRPNLVREMEDLAVGEDAQSGSTALWCIAKLPMPLDQFKAPMQRVGQHIAEQIRKVNGITAGQDPSYLAAGDVSMRFSAWHNLICVLREKCGGDFTPELKNILELSRVRKDSRSMQLDVCRVASYYMQQWAGLAPLPTDPPPR